MALIRPSTLWLAEEIAYDGTQLRSHWIRETCGLSGSAMVAFCGPASVEGDALVDLEDRLAGAIIRAESMVHVLYEAFAVDLSLMVAQQRLLVASAGELLRGHGVPVDRRGDDLFVGSGKLSVSIATRSVVSALLHFAVNVTQAGTPVETAALEDHGIEPEAFAVDLMSRFADEIESMGEAIGKVRGVR